MSSFSKTVASRKYPVLQAVLTERLLKLTGKAPMSTASKQKTPSQTQMKEILRECAFDPRTDGPSRVIVEIAAANPRYAEDRAVELLREAQMSLNLGTLEGVDQYTANVKKAIGLLALALAVRS